MSCLLWSDTLESRDSSPGVLDDFVREVGDLGDVHTEALATHFRLQLVQLVSLQWGHSET